MRTPVRHAVAWAEVPAERHEQSVHDFARLAHDIEQQVQEHGDIAVLLEEDRGAADDGVQAGHGAGALLRGDNQDACAVPPRKR